MDHKKSLVQSLVEVTFLPNLFCFSKRKPLLPFLYNYGKMRMTFNPIIVNASSILLAWLFLFIQINSGFETMKQFIRGCVVTIHGRVDRLSLDGVTQ